MRVEVNQQPITALEEYGDIPIAFEVNTVLDVATTNGEFILTERKLDRPYVKRSAWIGGDSVPHVLYENIKSFSQREFPTFKTREEAMDWLVEG